MTRFPRRFAAALSVTLCACTPANCGNVGGLKVQRKSAPYAASPVFADGRAMREPPAGTVPRERDLGSNEEETGKDDDGNEVKAIPVPLDRALVHRGRFYFETYCAACHGLLGDGNSFVAHAMAVRPPPSLVAARPPPGRMFRIISEGYGLMPPYASQIPVRDRWGVVAYLQALANSQDAPLDRAPKEIRDQLERGGP